LTIPALDAKGDWLPAVVVLFLAGTLFVVGLVHNHVSIANALGAVTAARSW
jgi:hypothetical protein